MITLLQRIKLHPITLRVTLQPFTLDQTRSFLNMAFKGADLKMDEGLVRQLWEKTGGLPLYLEQVSVISKENI